MQATPADLVTTTLYDTDGNPAGYSVDHADDSIRVAPIVLDGWPVEQGCITFDAINGTWRYRFAGVERTGRGWALRFERVVESP